VWKVVSSRGSEALSCLPTSTGRAGTGGVLEVTRGPGVVGKKTRRAGGGGMLPW
jgi:hypothetical protein